MSDKEKLYEDIVDWASEATGGNAAFDPKYGVNVLNELRRLLGLPPLKNAVNYHYRVK